MIPPQCLANTPAGEAQLFAKLQSDPDTASWFALHSFDVSKHRTKIQGELDMVILVPGVGILCLEVKGCDVSRKDGRWIYPYETSVEGPFKQVSRAMHSLRDYVVRKDPTLSRLLFFSAVIFTRVDFREESPEWHPWQFISRQAFVRKPISTCLIGILENAHDHVRALARSSGWYDPTTSRPEKGQVTRLVSILRDDFEYAASPRVDVDGLDGQIRHFTEEQFEAIDQLEGNDRIVFTGPAGTGKTLLALEVARRAVESGASTLLLCFNALLGEWMSDASSGCTPLAGTTFYRGTLHRLMLDITGLRPESSSDASFWRSRLPGATVDCLLRDDRAWAPYDALVLDEAQDFLIDEYMDVFDLILRGGLAGGRWSMFGDFERQAIYLTEGSAGAANGLKRLRQRSPSVATFALRINCRNAEPIAQLLTITSQLQPGYKRVLHDMPGADVDPYFYRSDAEQQSVLVSVLRALRQTFKPTEIVVLSTRNEDDSCAGRTSCVSDEVALRPLRHSRDPRSIGFTTIHAFKGLESRAVVLTDIDRLDDERARALLYVGMSRARIRLAIVMHESCRNTYSRILEAGL